jgi:hypothetical protein
MQIARVAAVILGLLTIGLEVGAQQPAQPSAPAPAPMSAKYACPMRCEGDKAYGEPGRCPVCKMKLKEVPGESTSTKLGLELVKPPASELLPARTLSLVVKLTNGEKSSTLVTSAAPAGTVAHVFVVSEDLSWFDHEHGAVGSDGAISANLTFPHSGRFVVFTDLETSAPVAVTPLDVQVPGAASARTARKDNDQSPLHLTDGVVVTPGKHELIKAGVASTLTFTITRDGKPVTDIEPYVGSPGHLVLISEDLKQLVHSHPAGAHGHEHGTSEATMKGPELKFEARFPAAGRYGMWLQFQECGKVVTAPFVVSVKP